VIKINKEKIAIEIEKQIKIALVSDFEITHSIKLIRECVDKLNTLDVDIICLAGDFILKEKSVKFLSEFSKLKKPAFAVLGNHDFAAPLNSSSLNFSRANKIAHELNKAGVKVLRNEAVSIKIKDQEIIIAGIDDIYTNPNPELFFNQATILLCHNPDIVYHPIASQALLTLSGHVHGGTFKWLPFKKQIFNYTTCKSSSLKYAGLIEHLDRKVFVTKGVGGILGFIRIGIDREISYLTLGPKD
jgi:uncharacterized protein